MFAFWNLVFCHTRNTRHLTKFSKGPLPTSGHDWGRKEKKIQKERKKRTHHPDPTTYPAKVLVSLDNEVKIMSNLQRSVHHIFSLSQFCLSDDANCVPVVMNSLLCIQGETLKNWALKGCLSTLDLVMSDKNRGTRRSIVKGLY